jgi:hypothetical protein
VVFLPLRGRLNDHQMIAALPADVAKANAVERFRRRLLALIMMPSRII